METFALSLKDRIFFPLAALLAIFMVMAAIQPGIGRLPTGAVAGDGIHYDRIVIDGPYLNKVIAGGDATTSLIRDGQSYLLLVSAEVDALTPAVDQGPHFRIAADIEIQFAGRRIRVTARVRPADDRGASQVQMNYSAGRVGESGWQVLDLQPGFSEVSFEYDVPLTEADLGVDYLGIRPVVPDKSRAIVIEQIVLERLP